MSEQGKQKIKLLELIKMLCSESDEYHPMTTNEICNRLSEMGISCDRRTVTRDIALFNEYGYEVMSCQCGHQKGYYVDDRQFSIPELKILIDAVQAAGFITERKTSELIEKISLLGSRWQAEELRNNIVVFNTRKHSNESILYNVSAIEEALRKRIKISFFYFDLDENCSRIYRKEKKRYVVDPVSLVFIDDNYYLVCYTEKYNCLTSYRVDRMEAVEIEDSPICGEAMMADEIIADYTEQTFRMFGGEKKEVVLHFSNNLIGAVFDKFGETLTIKRVDENTCETKIRVQVSPVFWGWIFQFDGAMKIVSPEEVTDEYRSKIENAYSVYCMETRA